MRKTFGHDVVFLLRKTEEGWSTQAAGEIRWEILFWQFNGLECLSLLMSCCAPPHPAPLCFSFPKTLVIYRNSPSPLIWHSVLYLCQWAGTRLWLRYSAHIQIQIWHIWHWQRHDIIEKIPFFPPICPNHPEMRPAAPNLLSFQGNYPEARLPRAKIVSLLRSRIVDAECREACVFIQGV